jgi:VWFA-related protein
MLALIAVASATTLASDGPPMLQVTSPPADTIVSGETRLAVTITPDGVGQQVQEINFFVDGRLVCTVERAPFSCSWNAGPILRGHHVRVVATLTDGGRLVGNLHTKDVGYAERVRADAVLVPVTVRDHGKFVRGLTQHDFELSEDGVQQPIASLASEDAPLDLVVAVDISGSMEQALPDIRPAVKRLLSKLRPGDAVTLMGFNDTAFIVAERETNPKAREEAVDLLSSWGGTALYDATLRALDLVGRRWGRKGVVIFSDGDDRNSQVRRETVMARVQASETVLYTIGFGSGATVPQLRDSLESYAAASGGHAFFPAGVKDLDDVFNAIVAELSNQYVLSYSPLRAAQDGAWRNIKVRVKNGNYAVKARPGYRIDVQQRAGG